MKKISTILKKKKEKREIIDKIKKIFKKDIYIYTNSKVLHDDISQKQHLVGSISKNSHVTTFNQFH